MSAMECKPVCGERSPVDVNELWIIATVRMGLAIGGALLLVLR